MTEQLDLTALSKVTQTLKLALDEYKKDSSNELMGKVVKGVDLFT